MTTATREIAVPHRPDHAGHSIPSIVPIPPNFASDAFRSPLELDEKAMRDIVAATLDRVVEHVGGLSSSLVNDAPRGRAVAHAMSDKVPEHGTSFESLLDVLFEDVIPTSVNTAGPGYVGYIPGGGLFHSAVADFIAKSVNRHVGYYYMAPAMVQLESNVIRWFCDIVGYGSDAGGVLTSGGSMATLTAMIAARTTRLPEDFRSGVIYLTAQTHYSVAKAALLAGFPERCLRTVPTDAQWRMDTIALQSMVEADRAAGLVPFMVVATAGTTNTGAVDPLNAVADIAERERLWLHVDGAYGGFFILSADGRKALNGINRADSITLDPHKGLCLPYGTGALVTRNLEALKATYSARAEYLPAMNDVEGEIDFCGLSPELSRDWRGLRVWLPLMMHGVAPFRENIAEKLTLIRLVEEGLRTIPNVRIVASPQLSVLAFRLHVDGRSSEQLDALNQKFLEAITRRQHILLSSTRLDGRFCLRFALLSFRTHEDRVIQGLEDIRDAASEVLASSDMPSTIPGCFERQARSTPHRVALISNERRITFGALHESVSHLAAELQDRGLRHGGHVGIYMSRSVEAVVAIVAVLKAGGVCVPINPNDPADRQRLIIEDASLDLMVCSDHCAEASALYDPARIIAMAEGPSRPGCTSAPPQKRRPSARPDRPIYLLYTSGSTGRPKGVVGLEGATLNRLGWMWREFPFVHDDVCLHRTTLTFVDAVWEILGPLLAGVPLVIVDARATGDPDAIAAAVSRHAVTRITAVPSILDALVKRTRGSDALSSTRILISSGERLHAPLLARVRAALPNTTVLNLYGSTEVAGDVTCAIFPPGRPVPVSVPIGKPIPNARLFVLDERQQPVADDTEGELYVGGPVIAGGYHRRPDENAARFVVLPHLSAETLFRTGDRVRRDTNGVFHYVGRNDRQVKVRGVRIELDEVEAALIKCAGPGVSCAVTARLTSPLSDGESGSLHIAAFVAPATVDIRAIQQGLTARLPASMMPSFIAALDSLPLLPNGKIDRQALQALPVEAGAVPCGGALEELILSLWTERLPNPPTSLDSDFHLLGGDSLAIVEFLIDISEILGRTISVEEIPEPLTVAAMARAVERPGPAAPADLSIDVVRMSGEHRDAVLELLAESFSLREPMAAALGAQPDDMRAFAEGLVARCESEPFCYAAIERHSGRVAGFSLSHDYIGPELAFHAPTDSPKMTPVFDLLADLHRRYAASKHPRQGEVLEIAATGAADDVEGYAVARALERKALADARAAGFQRTVSICTNAVTRYLALTDQNSRILAEVPYASFEYDGRKVFAGAARHRGAALVEGRLS
jgi:aromatic-L-amino-acid decarboxylase